MWQYQLVANKPLSYKAPGMQACIQYIQNTFFLCTIPILHTEVIASLNSRALWSITRPVNVSYLYLPRASSSVFLRKTAAHQRYQYLAHAFKSLSTKQHDKQLYSFIKHGPGISVTNTSGLFGPLMNVKWGICDSKSRSRQECWTAYYSILVKWHHRCVAKWSVF